MPLFEIWESTDMGEIALIYADAPMHDFLTKDVYDNRMVLIASFAATSWEEAKEIRDAILDWN